MSNPARLDAELQNLTNQIVQARGGLEKGEIADLSAIEPRVAKLCQSLRELPAEDAKALGAKLLAMVEELNGFEEALKGGLRDVKSQIGEATERRRAMQAYGRQKP